MQLVPYFQGNKQDKTLKPYPIPLNLTEPSRLRSSTSRKRTQLGTYLVIAFTRYKEQLELEPARNNVALQTSELISPHILSI